MSDSTGMCRRCGSPDHVYCYIAGSGASDDPPKPDAPPAPHPEPCVICNEIGQHKYGCSNTAGTRWAVPQQDAAREKLARRIARAVLQNKDFFTSDYDAPQSEVDMMAHTVSTELRDFVVLERSIERHCNCYGEANPMCVKCGGIYP